MAGNAFRPSSDFVDPRLRRGFDPECWPLCNGGDSPRPAARNLHERRCIEFLAAFYRVNLENRRLLEFRKARASQRQIRHQIVRVAAATAALEALEDRYAPIGFFGEPVMDGIRYKCIHFFRPERSKVPPRPAIVVKEFSVPGLKDIPKSELRGPVKVIRLVHGKVDF